VESCEVGTENLRLSLPLGTLVWLTPAMVEVTPLVVQDWVRAFVLSALTLSLGSLIRMVAVSDSVPLSSVREGDSAVPSGVRAPPMAKILSISGVTVTPPLHVEKETPGVSTKMSSRKTRLPRVSSLIVAFAVPPEKVSVLDS